MRVFASWVTEIAGEAQEDKGVLVGQGRQGRVLPRVAVSGEGTLVQGSPSVKGFPQVFLVCV